MPFNFKLTGMVVKWLDIDRHPGNHKNGYNLISDILGYIGSRCCNHHYSKFRCVDLIKFASMPEILLKMSEFHMDG